MATKSRLTKYEDIPCCPELETNPTCDVIDFRRRLVFPTSVRTEQGQVVRVEVTLQTRFSAAPVRMALGDLAYSTTLLPGEKVRLSTADRRTRFSFDSENEAQLSQRADLGGTVPHALDARLHVRSKCGGSRRGELHRRRQMGFPRRRQRLDRLFLCQRRHQCPRQPQRIIHAAITCASTRRMSEMSDNQSVEATRKAHSITSVRFPHAATPRARRKTTSKLLRVSSAIPTNVTLSHSFSTASTKSRRSSSSWSPSSAASSTRWRRCPCRPTPSAPPGRSPRCRKTCRLPTPTAWQSRNGHPGRPELPPACPENVAVRGAIRFNAAGAATAAQALGTQVPMADELQGQGAG